MTKSQPPTNFVKHTSKNPIQKFLINNFFANLIALAKPLKAREILDAGCGEGFTMEKLTKEKVGKRIEGIEYSKDAIAFGKKIYPHLVIKHASIYELPYKDKSFDLVVCTEVLEHLGEPKKALKEMLRVSKKYLLISVPNEPLFMISNFLRGKNISRFGNDIEHINHWGPLGFTKFLTENKVKTKRINLPFPWTIVLGEK
jgi:2-polyprenyl-3-methyl-5-hydroxy-6-metoxy-1,4-benzoquinol methylase